MNIIQKSFVLTLVLNIGLVCVGYAPMPDQMSFRSLVSRTGQAVTMNVITMSGGVVTVTTQITSPNSSDAENIQGVDCELDETTFTFTLPADGRTWWWIPYDAAISQPTKISYGLEASYQQANCYCQDSVYDCEPAAVPGIKCEGCDWCRITGRDFSGPGVLIAATRIYYNGTVHE